MTRRMVPYDGNSAVAHVAHATNEVIAIYPITPSSAMGEIADGKSAKGEKNIWGTVPVVVELQSEGGASGTVHGALTTGALTTTFTASQGLLLMIPNMYKIAGELCSTVFHIAARSIACQALSIFGDHTDVMATRATGWAMLASGSVQEAMDFALIAQAATLEARVPFLHFFEGFRISHEIQKIEELTPEDMRAMIDTKLVRAHRLRGLSPDRPQLRGTSQNPDVFFQGRESVNKYYNDCPGIVQKTMNKFAQIVGRQYKLFDYIGAPDAENVIVIMGSGGETVHETVEYLNAKGEKIGVIKVRLYRPFDVAAFASILPNTVKRIAVLDRTKEPGSLGEPLYEDIRTAIGEAMERGLIKLDGYPLIIGGRYGLGSAEFNGAMAKGVFDNLLKTKPKDHFTIGIEDDITHTSLEYDPSFSSEKDVYRAMFYGLGSDGTVGANHNSIKIIAEKTDNYAQGYFVYDSKKAGAVTVSHLRFGKKTIRSPYLISKANFLACHNFTFLEKYDMLKYIVDEGTFLLTSEYDKNTVWEKLPPKVQKQIIDKNLKFYVIDAVKIASELGLSTRINTIMQTAFFLISDILPKETAISAIKESIKRTYGEKGEKVVNMNTQAVDATADNIQEVEVPHSFKGQVVEKPTVADDAPDFVKEVTARIIRREGESIKVSQMPSDGTWPTGTTQYEKRNLAINIPIWNPETCIQCGRCSLVCPHAAIRPKIYKKELLKDAPKTFKHTDSKPSKDMEDYQYTLQVAPEDCTGCGTCFENCPMKNKEAIKMSPQSPIREEEVKNYAFFLNLPDTAPDLYNRNTVKGSQFIKPLFEYSGACGGCGETAYVKLLTQLFGDRAIIANATGCSSIYGGNLPTTPYCKRSDGRGPAWNNSLFEDAAELAFGMRLTVDKFTQYAYELADRIADDNSSSDELKNIISKIKDADQSIQEGIEKQRERVEKLKNLLKSCALPDCKELLTVSDYMVKKSIWGIGGDGWAYDIGYGGLDHVLASGKNVNILVLDTEVYSNTGGQSSKATPLGAVAKFAAAGKPVPKKDLGLMFMSYGYIYVAKVAVGADPNQLVKAFVEAEAYKGPSIIIAYSHCIAHGIDMTRGLTEQKNAVASGYWPLYRYNPELTDQGENPLILDSKEPQIPFSDYAYNENRYRVLKKIDPKRADKLMKFAQQNVTQRFKLYKQLAELDYTKE
ncbi:MAG: pyruvate:ferredoxin (flavodoxin) oxidoreductase [bacterium]|nr:pyruvate:ferredoxin (flavodoxin) oxidoreductase [bacterium]